MNPTAIVNAKGEDRIRGGHPWIYRSDVVDVAGVEPGIVVNVCGPRNRDLGRALFSDQSQITLRMIARDGRAIDTAFWRERLERAISFREILEIDATAYRLVHGEADLLPSLVVDRYGDYLVLQALSQGMDRLIPELVPLLVELTEAKGVLARNDPKVRLLEGLEQKVEVVHGAVPETISVREAGVTYDVDPWRGQKTGLFLDQRENRRRVETLAAGRDVLNAFSFSGGFSLYAARGGARSTTDLDISSHALDSARRNFALNAANPHIAACRHECAQADTFDWLAASTRADFDLVILDPPSLAKREAERAGAIQAYRRLTLLGLPRLRPGGILVAASCSAHVSAPEFHDAVLDALRSSRRKFVELVRTAHAPDHPATFPEAQYLKCVFARLEA